MVSEKDIKFKELGPGKGSLLTISGKTAEAVVKKADELGVNASEMVQALIQAYTEGEIKLPDVYTCQGGFEVTRELTDSDLVGLCAFADKLDATGHGVYAIQFNEHLEELARETGLSILEIKNRAREYRGRRV